MKKQFIAKLLALALVMTLVPATIIAAGAAEKKTNDAYYSVGGDTVTTTPANDLTNGPVKATVVNGTAKVSVSDTAIDALSKTDSLEVEIDAPDAVKVEISFSAKALNKASKNSDQDLVLTMGDTSVITIPNEALSTFGNTNAKVNVVSQNGGAGGIGFNISVSGKPVPAIKGLTITF